MTKIRNSRTGGILAASLLLFACAHAPVSPVPLEQDIRAQLDALGRAVVERDAAAIERLVADEYTFAQPDTQMTGKRELLASISPASPFTYLEHRVVEIDVRRYGDTAVSNGRFTVAGKVKETVMRERVRFTAVHVQRGGRWQLVALHSTFEPQRK